MIIGVGIDLASVERMAESLESVAFRDRTFTPAELASAEALEKAVEHLAGKFAVKEALMKAVGKGLQQGVWFSQIEVLNTEEGQPEVTLQGQASHYFEQLGVAKVHVSITHTGGFAVGLVVLEG